jgi:transposase-like protein
MVHFERNVLSHAPASAVGEAAEALKAIVEMRREKSSRALAEEFVSFCTRGAFRKGSRSSRRAWSTP